MDPEYKKDLSRIGIKKGHVIEVVVREKSPELPQKGGAILWKTTGNQFGSMHAVIKAIYEALPTYKGKRIFVEVRNKANGKFTICSSHYVPLKRIPFTL